MYLGLGALETLMYLRDGSPRDKNIPGAGSPRDINIPRADSPRDINVPRAGSPLGFFIVGEQG